MPGASRGDWRHRKKEELMLRIRFHGRGGQGMKTASRIVGSAAFEAGYMVQDSPVYGAERRGAPIAAFTRIAHEPILERGAIAHPDLVVVADDTLLTEPASQPAAGCDAHSTLLINTHHDELDIRPLASHGGRILTADFTTLALKTTQNVASLSTALGTAAASLIGLSLDAILAGLDQELSQSHLTDAQQEANRALARAIYTQSQSWARVPEQVDEVVMPPLELAQITFVPAVQAAPSIFAMGNSPERHTGSWRQFRPVLQPQKCTRCWLCFVWCPEAAITLGPDEYPIVDYDVCKGCLLCAHECPTHAFNVEEEV
jgi:pyruvate ferredoxin oxidoreductase gamma subunit